MPRPLRIHYPNAWYHVMNRGAGRRKIFKSNYHRLIFLELLEECTKMFNLKVYAYCLMDNHYHLLVSTPDANISRVMRHINGVYTQKFNLSLKTDGPLFRGRYKAQLVEDDCYQLIVTRYIHLNPVEAGLVTDPADYKWSSYAAYLDNVKMPEWLSANVIIKQLSQTPSLSHVKDYKDYVEEKCVEEINVFTSIKHTAPILGSVLFKEKILSEIDASMTRDFSSDMKRIKTIPDIELIMEQVCLFYQAHRESLIESKPGSSNRPKMVYMYICRNTFGHLLREIAQSIRLHRYEAVSATVKKCHVLMQQNQSLVDDVNMIIKKIRGQVLS